MIYLFLTKTWVLRPERAVIWEMTHHHPSYSTLKCCHNTNLVLLNWLSTRLTCFDGEPRKWIQQTPPWNMNYGMLCPVHKLNLAHKKMHNVIWLCYFSASQSWWSVRRQCLIFFWNFKLSMLDIAYKVVFFYPFFTPLEMFCALLLCFYA